MTREVWMPVLEYEGIYEVSNLGRISRGGKFMSAPDGGHGYRQISLSKAGVVTTHRLHIVVLTAFCGPRPFDGAEAAHNDGDKDNCCLTNLRWTTPLENAADVGRHGKRLRGEDVFGSKLTESAVVAIRSRIQNGERNPSIAGDFGVSISTIHLIRHNKIWRHV